MTVAQLLHDFDLFEPVAKNSRFKGLKSNAIIQWIVLPLAIVAYTTFQAISYQTPTLSTSTAVYFDPKAALFDFKATCLDPAGCVVIPATSTADDVGDFDIDKAMVVAHNAPFVIPNIRATPG